MQLSAGRGEKKRRRQERENRFNLKMLSKKNAPKIISSTRRWEHSRHDYLQHDAAPAPYGWSNLHTSTFCQTVVNAPPKISSTPNNNINLSQKLLAKKSTTSTVDNFVDHKVQQCPSSTPGGSRMLPKRRRRRKNIPYPILIPLPPDLEPRLVYRQPEMRRLRRPRSPIEDLHNPQNV